MRKLQLLNGCLNLFWFLALVWVIGTVIILPFELLNDVSVKIKGMIIESDDYLAKALIIIYVITQLLFVYSIYLLRKIVRHFQKLDIFNIEIIHNFNLMGKLIILSTLISNISFYAYKYYTFHTRKHEPFNMNLDTYNGYDSFLIAISLGLFFMVISEVFKIAKGLKEENELTI